MSKIITVLFFQSIIVCFMQAVYADKIFEDTVYSVFDTGLIEKNDPIGPGVWLDDSHIVINTHDYKKNKDGQWSEEYGAVLFDSETKEKIPLTPKGLVFFCYDDIRNVAGVRFGGFEGNKSQKFIRIDILGNIKDFNEKLPITPYSCRPSLASNSKALSFLRIEHGYIEVGKVGGGYSSSNAILYRPLKPPLKLPIAGGEINSLIYLKFLNKYLLNNGDSRAIQVLSDSGQVISGARPFVLMSPEGDITYIPFPESLVNEVFKSGKFDFVLPVKPGLLVARSGKHDSGESGLFLVQESEVKRIWGKGGDYIINSALSPDGCKLAFLSFKVGIWGRSPETVKIIDFCEGER